MDPSDNIKENKFVHRQEQTVLEDYNCSERFNLATFRMVAEHVAAPESFLAKLFAIMEEDGLVVLLTPNRWSPVPLASSIIPNNLHYKIIRLFSIDPARLEEDVFPTAYLMNTRLQLARLFDSAGFDEVDFAELADCTVIQHFRWSLYLDLLLNKALSRIHLKYPERNLLGIYRRRADGCN